MPPAPGGGRVLGLAENDRQGDTGKRVGPAELFFDLVFVLAVTQVSTLLELDHSWAGLVKALIAFVPVYWLWVGTAIRTNQVPELTVALRIGLFAVALAAVFMAVSLPRAYEDLGLLFALAYWAGRWALGLSVLRSYRRTLPINPFTVSMFITGPLLVAGALCHDSLRVALWALAALIDLGTPVLLQRQLRGMRYDAGHLAERFGLFVLIALGESVVAIGASLQTHEVGVAELAAVATAFVASCGIWWVYFHFAADMIGHVLATARVQLHITRAVLSYGHLLFIGAIIVLSVGLHRAVEEPTESLGITFAALLFGGSAAYLATFGMTRWVMRRRISVTRLSAAATALVLIPAAASLPAIAALALLAVLLVALNAEEYRRAATMASERRPWDVAGARAERG